MPTRSGRGRRVPTADIQDDGRITVKRSLNDHLFPENMPLTCGFGWSCGDLNPRPPRCERGALPDCATAPGTPASVANLRAWRCGGQSPTARTAASAYWSYNWSVDPACWSYSWSVTLAEMSMISAVRCGWLASQARRARCRAVSARAAASAASSCACHCACSASACVASRSSSRYTPSMPPGGTRNHPGPPGRELRGRGRQGRDHERDQHGQQPTSCLDDAGPVRARLRRADGTGSGSRSRRVIGAPLGDPVPRDALLRRDAVLRRGAVVQGGALPGDARQHLGAVSPVVPAIPGHFASLRVRRAGRSRILQPEQLLRLRQDAVRLVYPPRNADAGPDGDDREIEDGAAHGLPPRSCGGLARRKPRCVPVAATGMLTSRTVKPLVRLDEHSARCVARSRVWRGLWHS